MRRALQQVAWAALFVFGPTGAIAFAQQTPQEQEQAEQQQQAEEQQEQQQQQVEPGEKQEMGQHGQAQPEQEQAAEEQAAEEQAAEPQIEELTGVRAAINFDALDKKVIRNMQRKLQQMGFYEGEADGQVGRATQRAILSYQQQRGMEPTGQLDLETARTMNIGVLQEVRPVRGLDLPEKERVQKSAEVYLVQQQLTELGFYEASVDGVMGPKTEQAIMDFQKENDLEATGELDEETRSAMNLDSAEMQERIQQIEQQWREKKMQQQQQQQGAPQQEQEQQQSPQEQQQGGAEQQMEEREGESRSE